MEVQYYEVNDDEDEEDIPDEDNNTEMAIKLYDRIVPREAITKNIANNSYLIDSPFGNISSVGNDSRRESNYMGRSGNNLGSNYSSFHTPKSGYYERSNLVLPEKAIHIIHDQMSQRAVDNWGYLFKKCMLEYRRYRMRKAA